MGYAPLFNVTTPNPGDTSCCEQTDSCFEGRFSARAALSEYLRALGADAPDQCAARLLQQFGTLSKVLSSSRSCLGRVVEERVASALTASHNLLSAALLEPLRERPLLDDALLLRFIQFNLGSLNRECLVAIYLDGQRRILAIERVAEGSVFDVEVNVVIIIHRALDAGAAGFILVHNHPSGDSTPSKADVAITQRLSWIARDLNLRLYQHLVVSQTGVASVLH